MNTSTQRHRINNAPEVLTIPALTGRLQHQGLIVMLVRQWLPKYYVQSTTIEWKKRR